MSCRTAINMLIIGGKKFGALFVVRFKLYIEEVMGINIHLLPQKTVLLSDLA